MLCPVDLAPVRTAGQCRGPVLLHVRKHFINLFHMVLLPRRQASESASVLITTRKPGASRSSPPTTLCRHDQRDDSVTQCHVFPESWSFKQQSDAQSPSRMALS
jgi:hypothetical protein